MRLRLAFCPGEHLVNAGGCNATRREVLYIGDVGTVETIECRFAATDGGFPSGNPGAADGTEGALWLGETRQPGACLRLQRSTQEPGGSEYPAVVSPCSPSTTPCLAAAIWCTPHHPRQAAGWCWWGQK